MKRTITSEESSLTLVAVEVLIGFSSVKVLMNCWTTFSQMGSFRYKIMFRYRIQCKENSYYFQMPNRQTASEQVLFQVKSHLILTAAYDGCIIIYFIDKKRRIRKLSNLSTAIQLASSGASQPRSACLQSPCSFHPNLVCHLSH